MELYEENSPIILAIDPGDAESAYTLLDKELRPIEFEKISNEDLYEIIKTKKENNTLPPNLAIEMVASYGMPVGREVFETVFWIGRFWELYGPVGRKVKIYRKDEKMNLCYTMQAKDSNITQALVDRFAYGVRNHGKGTKKNQGWFYGFKKDVWQAYAVGVTYSDLYLKEEKAVNQ